MDVLRRLGIAALAFVAHLAYAQDASKPWSITLEQAWLSQKGIHGSTQRYTWAVLDYRISDNWEAVGGYYSSQRNGSLDENYIAYNNGYRIRMGRMNPNFGFSNWSDLFYTPFIAMPQFRAYSYGPRFGLFHYGSGADVQFGGPKLQAVVGAFDTDLNDQQLEPHKVDHVFGRVQTTSGPLILGVNAAVKTGDHENVTQKTWLLADARWTMPRLQVYGEAYYGETGPEMKTKGIVGSIVYRPPHLSRTQLAFRLDDMNVSSPYVSYDRRIYTGAVRQIINQYLIASLNYAWGDPDEIPVTKRGWSFQLMATVRF